MNKYVRTIKGVQVDVYDLLVAFNVTNPALQHLIKKALCAGLRGHKDKSQDMAEILESAQRAVELEGSQIEVGAIRNGNWRAASVAARKWEVED